jgi:FixJ family two-component response regulator
MSRDKPVVFVVDDDFSVRSAIELLVIDAGWQPKTFDSAQKFLSCPPTLVPNCLLLDVSLPDLDGIALQKQLAAERAEMPIIFITGYADISTAVLAMKAGAVEFLTKPFGEETLLSAIHDALDYSKSALRRVEETHRLLNSYALLSRREREVMDLVVRGMRNKLIGLELGISEITVKAHRGRMMQKMEAQTLAHLVKMSAALRLLSVEPKGCPSEADSGPTRLEPVMQQVPPCQCQR